MRWYNRTSKKKWIDRKISPSIYNTSLHICMCVCVSLCVCVSFTRAISHVLRAVIWHHLTPPGLFVQSRQIVPTFHFGSFLLLSGPLTGAAPSHCQGNGVETDGWCSITCGMRALWRSAGWYTTACFRRCDLTHIHIACQGQLKCMQQYLVAIGSGKTQKLHTQLRDAFWVALFLVGGCFFGWQPWQGWVGRYSGFWRFLENG